jgi:hypothetical protein
MRKVYLAKSNACSQSTVNRVREYLKTLNIELKEYVSSKYKSYSHDELLACDSMIVLPADPDDYQTMIGKGIYTQIDAFSKMLKGKKIRDWDERILVITNIMSMNDPDVGISVSNFCEMEIDNPNDWTGYANLQVDCMTDRPVKKVFGEKIVSQNPCAEIPLPGSFSDWYSQNLEEAIEPKRTSTMFKLNYRLGKPTWWMWQIGDNQHKDGYTFTYVGDSRIDGMPVFKAEGASRSTVEEAFKRIGGISTDFEIEYLRSVEDHSGSMRIPRKEVVEVKVSKDRPMSPPSGILHYIDFEYGSSTWETSPFKYLLIG